MMDLSEPLRLSLCSPALSFPEPFTLSLNRVVSFCTSLSHQTPSVPSLTFRNFLLEHSLVKLD